MGNRDVQVRGGPLMAVSLVVLLLSAPSSGQEPVGAQKGKSASRLDEMNAIVRSITLFRDDPGARRSVELRAEPLHRWTDPTRELFDGVLWAWGGTGRPVALTSIEHYQGTNAMRDWSVEMLSLAPVPLDAETRGPSPDRGPTFHWTPPPSGLEMKPLPGAPRPAATEPARLRQVREIAARFTAEEVNRRVTDRRYVLRLLPRPIYRYSDPAASLLDGAFFLFVNGTNPEILLLIEARGEGPLAAWSYGAARLCRAAPEVFLDGRQVWSQPYATAPGPGDAYFTVRVPRSAGD